MAKQQTSANKKLGLYTKEAFRYDQQKDCYQCPAGKLLSYRSDSYELGRHIRYYSTSECRQCEIKQKCTRNKRVRRISRWVDEAILEEMERRVRAEPEKMKKRKKLAEHPFGTMKRGLNISNIKAVGAVR